MENAVLHDFDYSARVKITKGDADQAVLVVVKALGNVAKLWQITNKEMAAILGTSEASISRLWRGQGKLAQNSTEWQLALLLLRAFRGLNAYLGGDMPNQRAWLSAENQAIGGAPNIRMQTVEGLVQTVQYIDAIRGQ